MEFAIVLPLLVMFVFGIVEFGRGYNAKIELTGAVREGARAAALGKDAAAITSATRAAAPGLAAANITVVPAVCVVGSTNAAVTASYPFSYDIPLVGRRTATLKATGVMRCGA